MDTPLAFLVFNRPESTRRVFAEIALAQPRVLLVVADGPREGNDQDARRCKEVREILEHVTWPCEVRRNYSGLNLGCRRRISSGLDWVFSECEEAIILEDDCLPDQSFFPYCEALLDRYRNDERVMAISGDNFQAQAAAGGYSYYFSKIVHVWGWASWRRAWRHYDVSMGAWPTLRDSGLVESLFEWPEVRNYWRHTMDCVHTGRVDTWDYQWNLACWSQGGFCCLPRVNLVENIGFGPGAAHTTNTSTRVPKRQSLDLDLSHPKFFVWDRNADLITHRAHYHLPPSSTGVSLRAVSRTLVSELRRRLKTMVRVCPAGS